MVPGSDARERGANASVAASRNPQTRGNTDGSGTNIYLSGSNASVSDTNSRLPSTNGSGIRRGVSEWSTNAAERDANISDFDTNERKRHGIRRDRRARRARRQSGVRDTLIAVSDVHKLQTQMLLWARRLRDIVAEHELKGANEELSSVEQGRDETIAQLTIDATAHETITRQLSVETRVIKRLETEPCDGDMEPVVWMSHAMQLERNGSKAIFMRANFSIDTEHLVFPPDGMVEVLVVVGPQLVARDFAPIFLE